jgi:hypothetical protein
VHIVVFFNMSDMHGINIKLLLNTFVRMYVCMYVRTYFLRCGFPIMLLEYKIKEEM